MTKKEILNTKDIKIEPLQSNKNVITSLIEFSETTFHLVNNFKSYFVYITHLTGRFHIQFDLITLLDKSNYF